MLHHRSYIVPEASEANPGSRSSICQLPDETSSITRRQRLQVDNPSLSHAGPSATGLRTTPSTHGCPSVLLPGRLTLPHPPQKAEPRPAVPSSACPGSAEQLEDALAGGRVPSYEMELRAVGASGSRAHPFPAGAPPDADRRWLPENPACQQCRLWLRSAHLQKIGFSPRAPRGASPWRCA